jgi:hypothetical protein
MDLSEHYLLTKVLHVDRDKWVAWCKHCSYYTKKCATSGDAEVSIERHVRDKHGIG